MDLCRTFAIFGVIVIHACGASLYQYGKIPQYDWLSSNLLDSFVRCSVPLFVMLSGALLLRKNKPPPTPIEIVQRIKKIIIPLLIWNIAYLNYVSYFSGQPINWASMLWQAPMYHLWFAYMIIGIYTLLPALQAIFEVIRNRTDLKIYFSVLWISVTCIPVYKSIPLFDLLQQTTLLGYGGYFLIGGIINSNNANKTSTAIWILIYLASVAVTFFLTWNLTTQANTLVETAYLYFSPNVFLASISSFIILSRVNIQENISRIFHWISERSFLVFFMHPPVLERVNNYAPVFNQTLSMLPSILAIAIITYGICLVIATLLRKIPKSQFFLG